MREHYNGAMVIFTKCGKPVILWTIKSDSNWLETLENLLPAQFSSNRTILLAQAFHINLQTLMNDIKNGCFESVLLGFCYWIPKKRRLSHSQSLLILHHHFKFHDTSIVDATITAELSVHNTRACEIASRTMDRRPCETLNPNYPFMDNGNCTK